MSEDIRVTPYHGDGSVWLAADAAKKAVAWLREQVKGDLARAGAMGHFTVHEQPYYSCPASRTEEEAGDLEWGEEHCDCLLAKRKADAIAQCESQLGVLDEHKMAVVSPDYHDWGVQTSKWHITAADPTDNDLRGLRPGVSELHCRTCRGPFPCHTVTITASAYKGRSGYAEHWG